MKTDFKKILRELYSLDPSLEEKEEKILQILEEMITNKPDTHFDEKFKEELRAKVLLEVSKKQGSDDKESEWKKAIAYLLLGASGVAFAAFMFVTVSPTGTVGPNNNWGQKISFAYEKEQKADKAFGTISPAAGWQWWGWSPVSRDATSSFMDSKIATGGPAVDVPPYEQKIYKYVYSWSWFNIDETEMSVLLKKKSWLQGTDVSSLLNNFSLTNIDISKFWDLKLNTLNLSQNIDKWLNMNIDLNEWNIQISKNYALWPQFACVTEECVKTNKIDINEIPSDDKLLEIASSFANDFKLDLSSYWKPIVNKEWRAEYERATNKNDIYIPDTVYVVYPLVLDSKSVFEEFWQNRWITIWIDVRSQKVSEVSGLERLEFEESKYPVETNTWNILKIAEKWWRYWIDDLSIYPENIKITNVEVKLWEPTLSYVHMYDYKDWRSAEYMVPAMIFPVAQEPKEWEYFQKNIVVPIAKDLITENPIRLYK
ncbi:MAG: hypothetical protein ACD_2C00156G0008 [uncultured bacterium (gcode 4)]|uniref:Uncharacterized protein n=1 Tax=uncultured bacterium (gcode 4) TaxID=1234023 RepID=K2G2T5_9BACT|nr:MAG: hypothetical protein ACD_2C00156G0008 [uncultured bacterium (gcode 4)]